jgi:hypothetical protein
MAWQKNASKRAKCQVCICTKIYGYKNDRVQQLEKKEEVIKTTIQEMNQRKNSMSITEWVKGTQEMKAPQEELKTA